MKATKVCGNSQELLIFVSYTEVNHEINSQLQKVFGASVKLIRHRPITYSSPFMSEKLIFTLRFFCFEKTFAKPNKHARTTQTRTYDTNSYAELNASPNSKLSEWPICITAIPKYSVNNFWLIGSKPDHELTCKAQFNCTPLLLYIYFWATLHCQLRHQAVFLNSLISYSENPDELY